MQCDLAADECKCAHISQHGIELQLTAPHSGLLSASERTQQISAKTQHLQPAGYAEQFEECSWRVQLDRTGGCTTLDVKGYC
jgi:hypothetical protein